MNKSQSNDNAINNLVMDLADRFTAKDNKVLFDGNYLKPEEEKEVPLWTKLGFGEIETRYGGRRLAKMDKFLDSWKNHPTDKQKQLIGSTAARHIVISFELDGQNLNSMHYNNNKYLLSVCGSFNPYYIERRKRLDDHYVGTDGNHTFSEDPVEQEIYLKNVIEDMYYYFQSWYKRISQEHLRRKPGE